MADLFENVEGIQRMILMYLYVFICMHSFYGYFTQLGNAVSWRACDMIWCFSIVDTNPNCGWITILAIVNFPLDQLLRSPFCWWNMSGTSTTSPDFTWVSSPSWSQFQNPRFHPGQDESIFCASAWNENGLAWRIPGLGWESADLGNPREKSSHGRCFFLTLYFWRSWSKSRFCFFFVGFCGFHPISWPCLIIYFI